MHLNTAPSHCGAHGSPASGTAHFNMLPGIAGPEPGANRGARLCRSPYQPQQVEILGFARIFGADLSDSRGICRFFDLGDTP